MFDRKRFENSRTDGFAVLEIVDSEGPGGGPWRFVPLRRTEFTGRITGPLADLRLTQHFSFSRTECDRTIEALYRFPLPGDAAVTGIDISFGEVVIRAELKERVQAEQDYEEARVQGRQAALATRESPDVFTLRVTGIEPDQDVRVVTSYVQLAKPEGTGWTLRIPLTTAPRYVREDERGSRHADGQPLALLRDPGHRFVLDISLVGEAEVRSATHSLDVTDVDGGRRVRLQGGDVLPDRDCVLAWAPVQDTTRPVTQVTWHRDPVSRDLYFLALVTPPAAPATSLAREVIFLVDHSGSMEGAKWSAADWAVTSFFSGLSERDAFGLGLFHSSTRWLSRTVMMADARNRERAITFLTQHKDSGGTNLGVALEQALAIGPAVGPQSRHVLLVTDAEVSDSGRILRLVEDERKKAHRRRVSVLCIDAAPNSLLAHELAERGGGVARFLTSRPEEEDVTTALEEILQEWSAPVCTRVRLELDHAGVEAGGREVESSGSTSRIDLGDLTTGRSLWVCGRLKNPEGSSVTIRLTSAQGDIGPSETAASFPTQNPALKALFGARKVLALEYLSSSYLGDDEVWEQLERLGYRPEELGTVRPGKPRKIYAENSREELAAALRALLVREALEYGLASAETAFVAIRSEAGHAASEQVIVPNALANGWDAGFAVMGTRSQMARSAAAPMSAAAAMPVARAIADTSAIPDDLTVPPFLRRGRRSPDQSQSTGASPVMAATSNECVLWSGAPQLAGGEAILFDTNRPEDAAQSFRTSTLTLLTVCFPAGLSANSSLDPDLTLLLYVEDAVAPRVRIRLADLQRQGGQRPLNLSYESGQLFRVVLCDPHGAWAEAAPEIEVSIVYS